MKLEVGMYVRGKYYSYKGKIGKIIKKYNGDLEIAYKDSIVKTTVSSFIDDNFDINGKQYVASYDIIDIVKIGDYVNGSKVIDISIIGKDKEKWVWVEQMEDTDNKYGDDYVGYNNEQIKSIVTKEQMEQMEYKVGSK